MAKGNIPVLDRVSDYAVHYAQQQPEKIALVHDGQRQSYGELADRVNRLARALVAAGVAPGDRVAMLCTPRPEYLVVFLAVSSIGAIWVGLNPRYKIGEFRQIIHEARPKIIVALTLIEGRSYQEDLATLTREFTFIERIIALDSGMPGADALETFLARGDGVSAKTIDARRGSVGADDTAVIIFTSGSTGAPKGAMLSHFGLIHGALTEHANWPSRHPVVLSNMPINHIAGLGMTTLFGLIGGATLVFQERFDAARLLQLVTRERITFWLQSPVSFHLVANHPDFDGADLSSLEYIVWGGSPMAESLIARLYQRVPRLATAFGMTELSTYATYSAAGAGFEELSGSIGRPWKGYELRLADAEGRAPPPGGHGEIQARGRWLMRGYFGREDATRDAFTADGWFRTGDVALAKPDGNWSIVGRMKEMYKSGGYNIYPREIEIAIESHEAVALAAVIGVSDPVFHEVGHAFVELHRGCTESAAGITAWCAGLLANYKVPKHVTILPALPVLASGKIDKVSLRSRVQPPA